MRISILSVQDAKKICSCLLVMVSNKGLEKNKTSSNLFRLLKRLKKQGIFTGKKEESLFLPCAQVAQFEHLLFFGLGEAKSLDLESFRRAAGLACKNLESHSQTSVALDFFSIAPLVTDVGSVAQALTEGFILSDYRFENLKQKDRGVKRVKSIFFIYTEKSKEVKKGLEEGTYIADSTNFVRGLGDHPPNLMTPKILAEQVQKKLQGVSGLQVKLWDKTRIQKENMGGLLGVSLGSNQEPRMIAIEYNGAQAGHGGKKKPLVFVGKGLTFDSGGISLKPSMNMDEMKYDMCGALAVIGTLLAIARLKLKVHVIGLVGASENMPGAGANKPGDVLKARNGKTMEVLNTDAEGRLVLADILSYASEKNPEFIIDVATLTGAILVALGNIYTGLFTRNEDLKNKIMESAESSGEKMWPLPLNDFHVKDVKSAVADVANISSTRGAGSSTAAAFLEHFVKKGIPWAHLDIAGTAWNVSNRLPYCRVKTASGVMVRTFVELSRQYSR